MGKDSEGREQYYYRRFLQDVLDSLQNQLSLQAHIIDRIGSAEQQDALESVIDEMAAQMSRRVFDKHLSVFKSDTSNKAIDVTLPKREKPDEPYYLSIRLKDGSTTYLIRERSLGFRWFFTFLLLTQFRIARKGGEPPLFLFDEPASNLHQTAQQRLVRALEELTKRSGCSVIYTTHSHHLINPRWLESAYIVNNKALDVDSPDDYTASKTDVTIEKYRSFVGNHPDQRTYYQPILDILEYRPSNIENVPNIVMVEGKNDYYTLDYFQSISLKRDKLIPFLPGMGSGSLDCPIQLYIGWARNFIVLLDSDEEGEKQRSRYKEKFGQTVAGRMFTLGDIDKQWRNMALEKIISNDDRLEIQKAGFPESKKYLKKKFNLSIQEQLCNHNVVSITEATSQAFDKILNFLDEKLNFIKSVD